MLPKCNENRKFQEESPPGQHLEKGLEACHGPCNQEEGRTDGACFAAGKFISDTLHLKIKKLSTNSPGDFDTVLDTINHY